MMVRALAILLYAFLYLPLLVIVAKSFQAAPDYSGVGHRTLSAYHTALANPSALAAAKVTLLLALFSTVISTLLGTLLGYGLARHSFPVKTLFARLLLIPVAVPDIVMAVSLVLFYGVVRTFTGWLTLGFVTMLLAHITFQIPFVAMAVRARMRGLDPALEEAAYDLGASRWQRLCHVTLPFMRPGILAGALLALTLSLDDFVVSFFTSGPGSSTVPIYIYSAVKRGLTPDIHALATLLILASVFITIALQLLQMRAKSSSLIRP